MLSENKRQNVTERQSQGITSAKAQWINLVGQRTNNHMTLQTSQASGKKRLLKMNENR